MKKIIASLALTAALGAGLTAGAQAQTFGPTTVAGNVGIYSLSVLTNVSPLVAGQYTYSYEVTLISDTSGTSVSTFDIDNIKGYVTGSQGVVDAQFFPPGSGVATDFSTKGGLPSTNTSTGLTSISFAATNSPFLAPGPAPGGFSATPVLAPGQGQTAVFSYKSTLPPGGTVSLGSNGQNSVTPAGTGGNLAGTGSAVGPGAQPSIPETSSFALLGLGLLPLGLLARRRMTRKN